MTEAISISIVVVVVVAYFNTQLLRLFTDFSLFKPEFTIKHKIIEMAMKLRIKFQV